MGLITYTQLEDGQTADANKFNQRFGVIVDEINGNLDSFNLQNGAITRAKLADGAVNSAKMEITTYIDDNGWTVTDIGGNKTYRKQYSGNPTINAYADLTLDKQTLPIGVSSTDEVNVSWSVRNGAWEFQYVVTQATDGLQPLVYNASSLNNKGDTFTFDFVLSDK